MVGHSLPHGFSSVPARSTEQGIAENEKGLGAVGGACEGIVSIQRKGEDPIGADPRGLGLTVSLKKPAPLLRLLYFYGVLVLNPGACAYFQPRYANLYLENGKAWADLCSM